MCNLYNLKVQRWEYLSYFEAIDDWRNELEVTKDYAAPGKPGYVVRVEDGQRVLSTMKWASHAPAAQAPGPRRRDALPPRLADQLPQSLE